MTRLFNDPAKFADETVTGFVAAHQRCGRRVPGGVARHSAPPAERHKRRGVAGVSLTLLWLDEELERLWTAPADAPAGGTSGALWGLGLRRVGVRLGDQTRPTATDLAEAVHAARTGGMESGASFSDAWQQATAPAAQAAEATKDLLPRMGRDRPHAERSLGPPDAGAASLSLMVAEIAEILTEESATEVIGR